MSLLTPLYLAGALAVALPVLFHLIRRSSRREIPFSSLMFLSPSPPRITRRSRLEHLFLLALRALALVLLALAFSRPFWRQSALVGGADEQAPRQVTILLDTSASMRRDDVWPQAVAAVDQAVAGLRPQDLCAVFAFDESLRPIAGFEELAQAGPAGRRELVAERLKSLRPSWSSTHLGQALVDALALVQDAGAAGGHQARRIVLVSDMQSGSRLSVLGDSPWPADVELEFKPIAASPGNAGVSRLADLAPSDRKPGVAASSLRFRVTNSSDATIEQFALAWADEQGKPADKGVNADVPAGESRVVRMAAPPASLANPRLVLSGDAHEFDNTAYFVADQQRSLSVLYVGTDAANDAEGLRYYLERAVTSDGRRDVAVTDFKADAQHALEANPAVPLVVVTTKPSHDQVQQLRNFVSGGGALLYVVAKTDDAQGLAALLELGDLPATEAPVDDYAILGDIRFDHPLFAAMAGPKFNDFTQIRFWKHRRLDISAAKGATVLTRFDGGDPAIVEWRLGKGRVLAMTSSWRPRDSQLARSWKFPLMLSSLIAASTGSADFRRDYVVGDPVPLPDRSELASPLTVADPDGVDHSLPADASVFAGADRPGIFTIAGVNGPLPIAVNVDPLESETAPLPREAFEQLGCRLPGGAADRQAAERQAELRDAELESRQKVWQWLLAATLGVLVIETWLAGRLSRVSPNVGDSLAAGLAPQG